MKVCNKLFSNHFICSQTTTHVKLDDIPDDRKGHRLTWESHLYIILHPEPESTLIKMLDVLEEEEPLGPIVAKRIWEVSVVYNRVDIKIINISLSLPLSLSLSLSLSHPLLLFVSV